MRRRTLVAGTAGVALLALYLNNASWLAPAPRGMPRVLAHRGVHQTFCHDGLALDACTAILTDEIERIGPESRKRFGN